MADDIDFQPSGPAPASSDGIDFQPHTTQPSYFDSATRGLAQGASLGFADEISGGANAAVDALKKMSLKDIPADYAKARDTYRAADVAAQKANPNTYNISQLAGGVVPALAIPVAGETMAARAAAGAGYGALAGYGYSDSKSPLQQLKDIFTGGTVGAASVPVVEKVVAPLAIGAMNRGADLAGWAGKKALNTILGVPEATTEAYMANPEAINAQRPLSEIRDELADFVKGKQDAVGSAKDALYDAKDARQTAQTAYNDAATQTRMQMQSDRMALQDQAREAADRVTDQYNAHLEAIKNAGSPMDLAESAQAAVAKLKESALGGEEAATDLVANDPNVKVPLKDLLNTIDQTKSKFAIGANKNVFTGANKEAASELDNLQSDVLKLSGLDLSKADIPPAMADEMIKKAIQADTTGQLSINGADARTMLKSLNKQIDFLDSNGGFTGAGSQALNAVRQQLRETLGTQSPEYAKAMEAVAPKFNLLEKANKYFGSDQASASTLPSITKPQNGFKAQILRDLGDEVGFDFGDVLDAFGKRQDMLSSPTQKAALKSALPASTDADNLRALARKAQDPQVQAAYLKQIMDSMPHTQVLNQANAGVDSAQAAFEAAQNEAAPFQGVSEKTLQGILKSGQKGDNLYNNELIGKLSQATGKDYATELANARVQEQLTKGRAIGGRNTLLGTSLGTTAGVLSHVLGLSSSLPEAAMLGSGIGSVGGAAVDKYGGPMAKNLMDIVIAARNTGSPLPPAVQQYLGNKLSSSVAPSTAGIWTKLLNK